jgi:anti-sigma B factor antagonist
MQMVVGSLYTGEAKHGTWCQAGALPMLHIKSRNVGDITVLELSGTLVLGMGLDSLRSRIEKLVAEQRLSIVLNAKDVSVIDSSGVGDLVGSFSMIKKNGGTLKIASPTNIVREVLRIARLPTLIEIYETEEAALKSFAP